MNLSDAVMLWATPNTMDHLPPRSYEAMKRQATHGGRKNRKRPGNLREQLNPLMCKAYEDARRESNQKLWPTPTTARPHDTENTVGKYMPSQNQFDLAAAVNLWPTPRAQTAKQPCPSRVRHRQDLQTKVMFTTPCAGDSVGTNGGGNGASLRTDIGGQLNPDWVDWLMGFPVGWTNIDLDMPLPDYDPQYFDTEPNIPRTATGIKNRVDRIICDGNAVVPYQAYPVFKAIAEIEKA